MSWPQHQIQASIPSNVSEENRETNMVACNSLTNDELKIYKKIHSYLSQCKFKEETAILIDSMWCDRKSVMLLCLSKTLKKKITYIAFRRTLAQTFDQARDVSGYTVHKFFMRKFNFGFYDVDFKDGNRQLFEMLHKMLLSVSGLAETFEMLILDEYTIVSPWCVLWMYWIAKYHRVPIIISGDKSLLGPMHRSRFHGENSYSIAKILAEPHCCKLLNADSDYRNKLAELKQILDQTNDNVPLGGEFESKLRSLFEDKFSLEENFEAIFLARCHADLYRRAYRIMDNLTRRSIEWYRIPYYTRDESTNQYTPVLITTPIPQNGKFLDFLPLIQNFMYTYTPRYGVEKIVKFNNFINDEIIVTDVVDNMVYTLGRVELEFYHCVREEYDWLHLHSQKKPLYQYPLRLLCKTYHSIQGSTMPTCCKIELDLTGSVQANAVYVGMLSVTGEEQLGLFHTDNYNHQNNTRIALPNEAHIREQSASELIPIARYLRDVPRDNIISNSNSSEDLERHFEQWRISSHLVEMEQSESTEPPSTI